jgi:hypothetical protein
MKETTGPMNAVLKAIAANGDSLLLADIKAKKVLQGTDDMDPRFRSPIDMRTVNAMLKRGILDNTDGVLTVAG